MDKKGASHVDWALSMGIFIIYVFLTIIFIRPGVEQVQDPSNMMGLTLDGLENDTTFGYDRIALIIFPYTNISGGGPFVLEIPTTGIPSDWDATYMNITNKDGTVFYDFAYSPPNLYISVPLTAPLTKGVNNFFYITYNSDYQFSGNLPVASFVPPPPLEDIENFTATIGVMETKKGFNYQKLNTLLALTGPQLSDLKRRWNLPENINFSIQITPRKLPGTTCPPACVETSGLIGQVCVGTSCEYESFLFEAGQPFEQQNVFVKQVYDWYLTENGDTIPINLILSMWGL